MADLFDILLAKNLAGGGGGGGSAIAYTSIVDNGDNTITAMDDKGVEHTVAYTVGEDGKITSVSLDGKTQSVSYDENGVLTAIGETEIDIEEVPVANEFPITVTFMNGTDIYGKVGITDGMKIAEPTEPIDPQEGSLFVGWYLGDALQTFPIANLTEDIVLEAKFNYKRVQMEVSEANTLLVSLNGTNYYKENSGLAIIGQFYADNRIYVALIADTISAAKIKDNANWQSFTYDGTTYYAYKVYWSTGIENFPVSTGVPPFNCGSGSISRFEEMFTAILDKYFGVT